MARMLSSLFGRSRDEYDEVRWSILDAATCVYAEKGYHATNVEHVATAAHTTPRMIFNMFGSMGWLHDAVVEFAAEELLGHTQVIHATAAAQSMLDELLQLRVVERERFLVLHAAFAGARYIAAFPEPTDKALVARYRMAELTGSCLEQHLAISGKAGLATVQLSLMLDDVAAAHLECLWPGAIDENPQALVAGLREAWQRALQQGLLEETPEEQIAAAEKGLMSRYDMWRLRGLINALRGSRQAGLQRRLKVLEGKLNVSQALDPSDIPGDVVTMESHIVLHKAGDDAPTDRHLVFCSSGLRNEVSVLEPLGIALLGSRVGSIVRAEAENQQHEFLIQDLSYQPESAGNPCH